MKKLFAMNHTSKWSWDSKSEIDAMDTVLPVILSVLVLACATAVILVSLWLGKPATGNRSNDGVSHAQLYSD